MKTRQKAPKRPEPQQNWFELEAERQETADVHPLEWMIGVVVAVIMGTSPDVNISTLGLFASVIAPASTAFSTEVFTRDSTVSSDARSKDGDDDARSVRMRRAPAA